MRTRDGLGRLALGGRPLLAEADALVDADEEYRILRRILASGRPSARPSAARRLRPMLLLAGAAIAAVLAVIATGVLGPANPPAARTGGHGHLALSGSRIDLAGYRFRTPAGFKASTSACEGAPSGSGPRTVFQGFAAAASAEGGCVEAGLLRTDTAYVPAGAEPVEVGSYQGYFLSHAPGDGCHLTPLTPEPCSREQANASGDPALYVEIPDAADSQHYAYLVLFSQGLTESQLIAVAESGLPTLPLSPATTTCTENCG